MSADTIQIDISALTPDRQVDKLKRQYLSLRGQGEVLRARLGALPCILR